MCRKSLPCNSFFHPWICRLVIVVTFILCFVYGPIAKVSFITFVDKSRVCYTFFGKDINTGLEKDITILFFKSFGKFLLSYSSNSHANVTMPWWNYPNVLKTITSLYSPIGSIDILSDINREHTQCRSIHVWQNPICRFEPIERIWILVKQLASECGSRTHVGQQ